MDKIEVQSGDVLETSDGKRLEARDSAANAKAVLSDLETFCYRQSLFPTRGPRLEKPRHERVKEPHSVKALGKRKRDCMPYKILEFLFG